jgi:hypothetical protein
MLNINKKTWSLDQLKTMDAQQQLLFTLHFTSKEFNSSNDRGPRSTGSQPKI